MSNFNVDLEWVREHSLYGMHPSEPSHVSSVYMDLDLKDFPASIQIMTASLVGIRDALVLWKTANDRLTGDAAALRGNMLNLVIDNLNHLVLEPLQEVRYK